MDFRTYMDLDCCDRCRLRRQTPNHLPLPTARVRGSRFLFSIVIAKLLRSPRFIGRLAASDWVSASSPSSSCCGAEPAGGAECVPPPMLTNFRFAVDEIADVEYAGMAGDDSMAAAEDLLLPRCTVDDVRLAP